MNYELYVATNGDDQWSGQLPEPNAARTDGPFKTINAAQQQVRALSKKERESGTESIAIIRVNLRAGVYLLNNTWDMEQDDSGRPRLNNGMEIDSFCNIWRACPGEKVIISGGITLNLNWQPVTVNSQQLWTAQLPQELRGKHYFEQLWVNGERRPRPSLPRQGFFQTKNFGNGFRHFHLPDGVLSETTRNINDIELRYFSRWTSPRGKISSIDFKNNAGELDRDAGGVGLGPNDKCIMINVFEALSEPGEWYLDSSDWQLYYLPCADENIANLEFVVSKLPALLKITNTSNLIFENITFAYSEWIAPTSYSESIQASFEVPGAVQLNNVNNISFNNCEIEHVSTYAAAVEGNSSEVNFFHCVIRDLGAGGIRFWHGTYRNTVRESQIYDGGHIYPAGVGVLIGQSNGNMIEHNTIRDLYYTGVSLGWNWGFGAPSTSGNVVEYNHIYNIGRKLLSDMGGIYQLGASPGTRFRYNHIHDVSSMHYGGNGIYLDQGSSDVLVEHNLVHHVEGYALNINYAYNNVINNNIFAYGGIAALGVGAMDDNLCAALHNNILFSGNSPITNRLNRFRYLKHQLICNKNLFFIEEPNAIIKEKLWAPTAWYTHRTIMYAADKSPFIAPANIKLVVNKPTEQDWANAIYNGAFVNSTGSITAPENEMKIGFLQDKENLYVRFVVQRQSQIFVPDGTVLGGEHVEIILKIYKNSDAAFLLGAAPDGKDAAVWYNGNAPQNYPFEVESSINENFIWTTTITLPKKPLSDFAGNTAALPDWLYYGLVVIPETGEFESWGKLLHDADCIEAEPGFIDPANGDFRLKPDAAAKRINFIEFDYRSAGAPQ